ncbi:hypothetical protein [Dyella psychrodurans]|uniref:P-type conjugative transfer protein TrbJ n=1 Tax=Dyella psychrodurans TaxID=1927960 RepID=A0A370X4U3_9GAMM|nr:hypothetical protein [Dyella psychrodurans]RDS83376.1 hypothetical protein DWU99_12640 [Dyella psychrodurans]
MKKTMQKKRCSGVGKVRIALVISCGVGVFSGSASAQWAVIDMTNIQTNVAGFAKQLAQTVQQYQTELQQYAQLLSSVQGLNTGMSLLPNQLQPISDPNSLIQANCSGASGNGLLGNVMNNLTSFMTQSITQSQQQICAQIVSTEVDKYNKTVAMLNQMNTYNTMFQQVQQVGQAVSTLADSGRANNQAQVYSSALATQMSNWQAQMQADDAVIKTLEEQQMILARVALNGSNGSILSDAMPDSTFQNVMSGIQ